MPAILFLHRTEPDRLSCEFLVRSEQIIRCNCVANATPEQRSQDQALRVAMMVVGGAVLVYGISNASLPWPTDGFLSD